jgi:pimeloyl-ACP methyl ester carboxylesterase
MNAEQPTGPDTIVLIHGLWMTPLSWENWIERYSSRGYEVLAPGWPGMDVDVDQLRSDSSAIDDLGIADILDSYDAIIRGLDAPPIIMGHSFGGAFTEILLDRGLGAAGVAIDAAAVRGITKLPFSTLKSGFPVLKNPANKHRAVALTFEEFRYSFTNTVSEDAARAAYERYAAPGPGRVLWEGAFANFNPRTPLRLDFKNPDRAPLLLIAGGSDHVVPAGVDEAAAKRFQRSEASRPLTFHRRRGRLGGGGRLRARLGDRACGRAGRRVTRPITRAGSPTRAPRPGRSRRRRRARRTSRCAAATLLRA